LTDGENHHVTRDDGLGVRNLVKVGAAFYKPSEINVDRPHARDVSIFVRHFFERAAWHDLDAFLARVADFPIVRGHFFARLEARHADPACAESHRRHRRVNCHIAAAQDQDPATSDEGLGLGTRP
jgi:hypothetical protein